MRDEGQPGRSPESEEATLLGAREGLFRAEALAHRIDDGGHLPDSTPISSPWLRWSGTALTGISLLLGGMLLLFSVPQSLRGTGIVWKGPVPSDTAPRNGGDPKQPRLAAAFSTRQRAHLSVGQLLTVESAAGSGEDGSLDLPIQFISEPYPSAVAVAEKLGTRFLVALPDTGPAIIVFTEPFDPSTLEKGVSGDDTGSRAVPVAVPLPPEPLIRVLYSMVAGTR